jgi:hypothetical protein
MKKFLFLFLVIALTSFHTFEDKVFICHSKGASKYHYSETCRGLNACKHEIKKVSISSAKEMGYELCGWEK